MADLAISTDRLILATPRADLAAAMLEFTTRNREHLKPWNPPEPPNLYTLSHWQEAVAKCTAAFDAGTAARFWFSPRDEPDRVIGSIGFSQIFRGPFCSCVLGYQIDRDCEGQGMMSEALRAKICDARRPFHGGFE